MRDLNKIASPQISMKAKMLSKLLHPVVTKSRRYYKFEGNLASKLLLLHQFITKFSGVRSYKNIIVRCHLHFFQHGGNGGCIEDAAVGNLLDGLVALCCSFTHDGQLNRGG